MSTFVQLFRFAWVGVGVTALHVLVATWLITAQGVSPVTANGIAFVTATLVSYIANTLWSFKHKLHSHSLLRFMSVSMVGLLSTLGISAVAQVIGLAYYFGIAAVVLVVPGVSFLLHRAWTYR
ncbi:MAG: GtrA family protein, partial [Saprospiraceae bacterium]|nr:GtrA family protein [Saprospiraceae bacterium]